MNPNQRTTSPSHDNTSSLRPINYSSSQRHSISVPNSSKQYPYDNSSIASSSSPQMLASSTPIKPNTLNIKMSMIQQQQQATHKEFSNEPISGDISERGRERKKTTIFGTLRKRLSRSKTRNDENGTALASNMMNNNTTNGYNSLASPNSLDSNKDNSLKNNSLKSPGSTFSSKIGISGSSRRSSISEMSNLSRMSNISNKTFLHEASSLVLEVIENGVKR